MNEYFVLTLDPNFGSVLRWITDHKLVMEVHLNRTRFFVPEGPLYTEFQLRFAHCCPLVDPRLDLATGLPKKTFY
jgi:hypothetical protein